MSQDFISEFLEFIGSHGYRPDEALKFDDNIHRVKVNGERGREFRYKVKDTGDHAYGWFTYKSEDTVGWHAKRSKPMSKADREALNARIEADRIQNEAVREKKFMEVAEEAKSIWGSLKPADPDHEYLKRKGIEAFNVKQNEDGDIVLPVYIGGQLWSLQFIKPDGSKKFLYNGKIKGGYVPIVFKADPKDTVVITEGYATAVSIRMATGLPVIVAFNAGNLKDVAQYVRQKFKDSHIIIAADNDAFTMKPEHARENKGYKENAGDAECWSEWRDKGMLYNTGLEKAIEAAKGVGCDISLPEFQDIKEKPTDFNDLHTQEGLDQIKIQIHTIKSPSDFIGDRGVGETLPESDDKHSSDPPPYFDEIPDHIRDEMYAEETQRVRELYDDHDENEKSKDIVETENVWHSYLKMNAKGNKPVATSLYNIDIILTKCPRYKDLFCYDEFSHQKIIVSCPPWENVENFKVRQINDADYTRIAIDMEVYVDGMKPSLVNVRKVLDSVVMRRRRHPAREYFSSLVWDGVPRLDKWLTYYCGAEYDDPRYLAAVGRKWMTAIVARVFVGGVKFDHMLIFEGDQSAGKSTMLRELSTIHGEEYFIDDLSVNDIGKAEHVAKLQGRLIVELAELSGMRKRDSEELKQAITTQKDTIVRKYENEPTTYPRQFVLAGTINPKDSGYLKDPTGNRRFWPVKVSGKIDIEALKKDKSQLWAEAMHHFKNGEKLYLEKDIEALAREAQKDRSSIDPWLSRVKTNAASKSYLNDNDIDQIYHALGIKMDRRGTMEQARLSGILTSIGYEWGRKRINGKRERMWILRDESADQKSLDLDDGEEIEFN